MSTRPQRSFFDQDKSHHNKRPWSKPRNANWFETKKSEPPPPPVRQQQVVTGPPIMPSSQTRNKLKAFKFIEGRPEAEPAVQREADKENLPQPQETPKVSKDSGNTGKARTPKLAQSKTCPPPSTPAARLPLADLVGNADAVRLPPKPIVSPEEQLGWRGSQTIGTPLPLKSSKRARSSSPAAPSQEEPKADLVRHELNTPQADPGLDLWARYTSNKGTPSAHKGVAFAHLINESSPRSSANAGSVSGLRRWASCGVEFPASAVKRRRLNGGAKIDAEPPEDVFRGAPSSDGTALRPEPSKLVGMLQRMRDSITKPLPKIASSELPSSSSPLPAPADRHIPPSDSPLQRHVRAHEALIHHVEGIIEEDVEMDSGAEYVADTHKPLSSSDEFEDSEFDVDMVEALEISQRGPSTSGQPNNVADTPLFEDAEALASEKAVDAATSLPAKVTGSDDDDFGVDDEDIFAADLEQVASLYDSRCEATPADVQSVHGVETCDEVVLETVAAPVINLVDDDSDDFGGDDIDADEMAAAEVAATQAVATSQRPSQQDTRAIQRYQIKRVDEGFYTTDRGYSLPEKVLLVEEEKTKLFKAITLRQAWYDTPCTPDSYVHVIGDFTSTGQCLIDDTRNMLILHPDHLISATVVADSFGCMRRAVLQDRIKATSRANSPMLYGTLLHELFQEAMKANRWDTEFLLETIDTLLPAKFETILEINSTCEQVKEHMSSKLLELQAWAQIFVRAEPRHDATVTERNGKQSVMSINKLLDVEEHVWSPMYGLKGNIDATVQVVMQDDMGQRTLTVPFEVKTGKNSSNSAHVAQTALYNLLVSNRYDVSVAYGVLYYLETSDISRIPAVRNEMIHMIIKRNELACYVRDRIELPPMLKEDFKCQKCYAQESCFLYHKLVEDGQGEDLNKKAKERYDELVTSLKPSDQDFMKKWDSLLTKEESDMMKFRRELWTMLSTEREKLGRCFSNVMLEPGSGHEEKSGSKINRYTYTFVKQKPKPDFSFTESQLVVGEPVVVSDEEGHFALANGYVTNVRKRRITVAVDRRLHNARIKLPGFDPETNQTFAGIMEVSKEGQPPAAPVEQEPVLYRLDKDEFSNGMAAARNNLVQIMDGNVYKGRDLRELIVNGRPPAFKTVAAANCSLNPSWQMSMNDDQNAAVTKVMTAKDYALVLGMPGTGKTTTIAHIIRALVNKGKSVLLTSYTHTAVDNILLKIRDDDIGILRLGASAKVHPEVREFAILGSEPKGSIEEVEKSWMEPPVVATTCLGINHPLFNRRIFDYCIVDEASQITLPVCLGPIRMAQTFILVGDHHQLPPLVQNKDASEGGLDVSLFKYLCDAHPEAVVSLEHQYRMCADIMLLSNTFIYSGRLKCGTLAVANRKLCIPKPSAVSNHHYRLGSKVTFPPADAQFCSGPSDAFCWLAKALDPDSPVVFFNTDAISTKLETAMGSRITNAIEARLVTHLALSLLSTGISANDIGVIAFYRSQLALLRSALQSAHATTQSSELAAPVTGPGTAAIELHTADKFQGRDKEIILVSSVRSNENGVVGDLLKDKRRINVALTRARSKIIILGSEKTLSQNELLKELVGLCRTKDWVFDLTQEMVDGHIFDEGVTQTGKTPASTKRSLRRPQTPSREPSISPTKRMALGDVTITGHANAGRQKASQQYKMKSPSSSPEILRTGRISPTKRFTAGRKGILNGRPVLRDVFNGAM